MFEQFDEGARQLVKSAQEQAVTLSHHYIGTEHLLLGLLSGDESVAGKALVSAGIAHEDAQRLVLKAAPRGNTSSVGQVPFTPRSVAVLELARQEARHLGHDQVTTGHILLGLIHEGQGVAPQVLTALGADLEGVCQQVEEELTDP